MIFSFPIRVYYEDTDHAGVVYYANYLKFMERGRTEMLRSYGIEQSQLQANHGVVFAVTEANIRYLMPARFDDALHVESQILTLKGARLSFLQKIYRHKTLLTEASIHLACMDLKGKPKRIPSAILTVFQEKKHALSCKKFPFNQA
ncbi:MAG: tol-pal system-associated acyl-CoA thioesterase [Mariprofundaceae bacterium]|nr:tol-pal system-associated acyl-CoA thioesterase [Mariprofundaceae bacterium]